jgi:dolichyl-phosphate-mannose-protein mannosyltransferase
MMTDKRMRRSGATIRYGAGRLLVFAGALAMAWATLTLVSGGFVLHIGPLALSSRDPVRPLLGAVVLFAAARVFLSFSEFGRAVRTLTGDRDQVPARIACAAAAVVLIFSVAWNTRAAGGSDSSCYVLQADAFAHGQLTLTEPLSRVLPEATPAMFAPTGFVPSRITPFAAVPICGPGLALAMAAVSPAGRAAVFLVVPVFAALAVWLTFVLGRRLDDGVTGACAAVLLATSPIFLYQSVQPMSDVPAAALWLAALVALARLPAEALAKAGRDRRGQIAGGVFASLAVLMRPNIALIVLPLVALLPDRRVYPAEAPEARRRGLLRFGLAAAPCVAVMAWLNAARYGSPLASGYGSTDVLFSFAHVSANLARYPRWLFETETPFIAAAVLAPWWAWRHPARARLVLVSLAAIVLTLGTYLAYTVFNDWWYIRFLLPALPLLIVLSVAVLLEFARSRPRVRLLAAFVIGAILGAWHLHVAGTHHVFELQGLESRFVVTGRYAARALPAQAVALAVQQSGSVRYHGGRSTIAWDGIGPDALDETIAWLSGHGHPAFIVLEDAEEPRFRARFSSQRFGRLDWPPHAEIHAPVRVRVYDPAERDRYFGGAAISTDHVR